MAALVINGPGVHTLTHDLSDADTVIAVHSGDVIINLNGKTVTCLGNGINYGIAAGNKSKITVNGPGKITGGWMGIQLGYGSEHVIDGVDLTGNRYIGANLGYGYNNRVSNVVVGSIGGYPDGGYAIGINGIGPNGLIEHVTITEMYKQSNSTAVGEGLGILVDAGANNVRLKNITMTNVTLKPNTMGVWIAGNADVTAENVVITNYTQHHAGFGTYTEAEPPDPPDPPDPIPPTGKFFRVFVDNVTYEGYLVPDV